MAVYSCRYFTVYGPTKLNWNTTACNQIQQGNKSNLGVYNSQSPRDALQVILNIIKVKSEEAKVIVIFLPYMILYFMVG